MKKRYEKPMVYFEDMTFDAAIAQVCTNMHYMASCQTDLQDGLSCSKFQNSAGKIFFDAALEKCDGGAFMCYHVQASSYGLTDLS